MNFIFYQKFKIITFNVFLKGTHSNLIVNNTNTNMENKLKTFDIDLENWPFVFLSKNEMCSNPLFHTYLKEY